MDRFDEGDSINSNGYDPGAGDFPGKDSAGNVHLGYDPATKDIAVWVGVGRHGQGSEDLIAFRLHTVVQFFHLFGGS